MSQNTNTNDGAAASAAADDPTHEQADDRRRRSSQPRTSTPQPDDRSKVTAKKKASGGKKTLWVDVHRCFECGRHGHNLPRCRQCSQAYYCGADCQRKHWPKHKRSCRAAVAALARHATRERLARAVREKGKGRVKGAQQDELCVICQAKPVDPVEVCVLFFMLSFIVHANLS